MAASGSTTRKLSSDMNPLTLARLIAFLILLSLIVWVLLQARTLRRERIEVERQISELRTSQHELDRAIRESRGESE